MLNTEYKPVIAFKTYKMSEEEWLNARKTGIGGSDASAIVGCSPFNTSLAIYNTKIGIEGEKSEKTSLYFEVGHDLEDLVAKLFMKRTGKKVSKSRILYRHPLFPFMQANIDRKVVGESAILECKTCSENVADEWEEGPPYHYEMQCRHYLAVLNVQKVYIACLIGGNRDFKYYTIERDLEIEEDLIDLEKEFWDKVINRNSPMLEGTEKAMERFLDEFMQRSDSSKPVFELSELDEQKLSKLERINKELKDLEREQTELQNQIKMALLDAEFAKGGLFTVKYKTQFRNTVDSKRLKEEKPEIYKEYKKESISRPFSFERRKVISIAKAS